MNSRLAWALFNTDLCCKPGLETRSYDRLQTGTGVILSLMSCVSPPHPFPESKHYTHQAIAKERGHKHDDPRRLFAHLKHAIDTRSRDTGSYWLATDEIVSEASSLMQKLWPTDVCHSQTGAAEDAG